MACGYPNLMKQNTDLHNTQLYHHAEYGISSAYKACIVMHNVHMHNFGNVRNAENRHVRNAMKFKIRHVRNALRTLRSLYSTLK